MSTTATNAQTTQPSSSQKTRSIGHYLFGKTLGEGTFGKVKVATHILTGEKVAIKILEKSKIFDVSDVERVSREIQILKMIRHPHLIQLYEIIETPKQLFLVMEFATGGELFDYIVQNQRIKDLEAARFFNQIIAGIEYIHKLNIVHRDMKPENLLLDTKNRIKIVDFGLSNMYKKDETLKTACGSPCYAAPEMIAGKRYNGLQVDIWSCGVILFAMLCGYLPFEDPNTSALYKKILAGDYKIPKFVSPEGRDLIKCILNTDPTKRYTIEDIRKHSWFNLYRQSKIPQGIIIGVNKIPVDQTLLSGLTAYGFQLDYAQKCIDGNRHNHVTTTYYLLLKKLIASGGKSIGDIGSDKFEPELLESQKSNSNQFILVQNQSNQIKESKGMREGTGGSSSKDKQELEHQLLARSQEYKTAERKPSLSIAETSYVKPQSRQQNNISNTTQNTSLNASLIAGQIVSNSRVKNTEVDKSYPEKRTSYRQKRAQNSVHTQNNSIMNSPRDSNQRQSENHSADNTRRVPISNQYVANLNSILNNPIDQPLFKTAQFNRQEKKSPNSFNITGVSYYTQQQMQENQEITHKNNTIYRQNLHLVADPQNTFLQQQALKNKIKTPMIQQQRPRGISQNEATSRMQKRLIIGRDSRGKSTEPMEDDNSNDPKMISVLDTSGYSNQGRTFYKSNRASPVMDTPNSRQYVVPLHLKFSKENPTMMNWRKKE